MKIGYLRVSLVDQKEDRQEDGLKAICDEIYVEKLSGGNTNRPVYQKVIKQLREGDTLVVWDLDRAFRSTIDALLEIEKLQQRGIEFQMMNFHVDVATPDGEFVYTMMAAYAQLERKKLIKRTKEGMEAARRRGKHIGRPYKLHPEEIILAASRIQAGTHTITGMASEFCCSPDTLSQAIRRIGLVREC